MWSDPINGVINFNLLAGNTIDKFNVRQMALYQGLILEELAEKMMHLGLGLPSDVLQALGKEFKRGDHDWRFTATDRVAMLDDDADLFVVTIGSMLSQGADVGAALNEVNRSNLSKATHTEHGLTMMKDVNGKVIKSPMYTPPNLAPYINRG